LITAGEKDHIIPASLARSNFNRYKNSSSITEFKEFDGRDHFLIGSPGWQEVADYSLAWLESGTI
jgi:pimeloyl-ACP methyl ester carboxylesterase